MRAAVVTALVIALGLLAPAGVAAQAARSDRAGVARSVVPLGGAYANQGGWFGHDKALHFAVSAAGSGGLYVAGRRLGLGRWPAAGVSALVMGTAGVLREIATTDRENVLTRDHVSRKDLLWDGIGIGVGIGTADLVHALWRSRSRAEGCPRPRVGSGTGEDCRR